MGKQLNFYMTTEDEREFVAFVRASGNVAIFNSVQASPRILELGAMPPAGEPAWFDLYIWNKDVREKKRCQEPILEPKAKSEYTQAAWDDHFEPPNPDTFIMCSTAPTRE